MAKHQETIKGLYSQAELVNNLSPTDSSSDSDEESNEEEIELHFCCKKLASGDMFSKSDPFIVLFVGDVLVGQTEIFQDENDPVFKVRTIISSSSSSSFSLFALRLTKKVLLSHNDPVFIFRLL